jgi:tetratricopeptide (TPR) repeat protein
LQEARATNLSKPSLETAETYIANVLNDRGVAADRRNAYDSAIDYFTKAIKVSYTKNQTWQLCMYNLANSYYRKAAFQQSADTLKSLLKIAPNYPNAQSSLEIVLRMLN